MKIFQGEQNQNYYKMIKIVYFHNCKILKDKKTC